MRRLTTLALGLALALAPATALAKPPANLHCPAGGTKVQGAGTHRVGALTLVVSGSSVQISGPADAIVTLCVKASNSNTGVRTVTLDEDGKGVFNSDVRNNGGNIADVSYTVVYSVEAPDDNCPDVPGYQDPQTDCDPSGSGETPPVQPSSASIEGGSGGADETLTAAFQPQSRSVTGAHAVAVVLAALALNAAMRKLLLRRH